MKIKTGHVIWIAGLALLAWWGWGKVKPQSSSTESMKIVYPHKGHIQATVSTTGTVLPKNRLEIKPPVNGRIEEVLVTEGQHVKSGETIAWMSSTERAALLDAARGKGEKELQYWQEVYKPIPLMAPIDADVIVATVQPGQTVTTSEAVIVLSDRLIVRAQVDETDIGKIKEGQKAKITLDAYSDAEINADVDHIYYESKTINNVTIYEVDLMPSEVPAFFRSGMNANVEFIQESKDDVLVLPANAVQKENDKIFVFVDQGTDKPEERPVVLGISDDKNIEIVSGLGEEDGVVLKTRKYSLPQSNSGTSPLMPQRRRRN
ncbi:MAG: efflux RND transporter periplasmic adaptor subunit [Candidatus Omnitrophica bacterium]|nr:efflux RND transporter periplasmic adaptor subunit [Candidatus Omnitrophota bacterium]